MTNSTKRVQSSRSLWQLFLRSCESCNYALLESPWPPEHFVAHFPMPDNDQHQESHFYKICLFIPEHLVSCSSTPDAQKSTHTFFQTESRDFGPKEAPVWHITPKNTQNTPSKKKNHEIAWIHYAQVWMRAETVFGLKATIKSPRKMTPPCGC